MKLFLLIALALGFGTTAVLGLPAEPQSTPAWYKISESELGPVYSSAPPIKRSSASWFKIGENQYGPIYSNIEPATVSRRDDQASSKVVTEYETWIAKNTSPENSTFGLASRSESQVERRSPLSQLALYVMNYGYELTAANGALDNTRNRVIFCINRCVIKVGAAKAVQDAYVRTYGDQAFPTEFF